jgi:deazaflavin-dependent oxidoreductase (nitroreductase family)
LPGTALAELAATSANIRIKVADASDLLRVQNSGLDTPTPTTGRTMREMNDYNRRVIEEFRANGGKVGGMWQGTPLLLLTTTGAKSGERRTTPMGYRADGDRLIVWASNGGSPTNPDWYHNLVAHPHVTVEVGTETFDAIAGVTEDAERDQLWTQLVALYPSGHLLLCHLDAQAGG